MFTFLFAPRNEFFVFLSLLGFDFHEFFELFVVVNDAYDLFEFGVELNFVFVFFVAHEHHFGLRFFAVIVRLRWVLDHFGDVFAQDLELFFEFFVQIFESVSFHS